MYNKVNVLFSNKYDKNVQKNDWNLIEIKIGGRI